MALEASCIKFALSFHPEYVQLDICKTMTSGKSMQEDIHRETLAIMEVIHFNVSQYCILYDKRSSRLIFKFVFLAASTKSVLVICGHH